MTYTATIVREVNHDMIYVRISKDGPQTGGDVQVVEVISDPDKEKLKKKALKFVQENINGRTNVDHLINTFH